MPQPIFKLSTSTIAILNENAQPRIVAIEANALVTLVDEDAEANGFVGVGCEDKVLSIFAVDHRSRGQRALGQSD
jgi:hypothetical protein